MKVIRKIKRFSKKYWPILIIAVFVLAYFHHQIISNDFPYSADFGTSDLLDFNYALKYVYSQDIKAGQLPLWSNGLYSGFPLLAEGQIAVFYPLNLILYYFLPLTTAFNLSIVLHFFLGALFFYWYARQVKITKFAAVFGALSFMFGAFFVGHIKHVNMMNAAIWLPLVFYLTEKLFSSKKSFYAVLISLFLAIQFFAGHPQISYYTLIAFSLYFLFRLILEIREEKTSKKSQVIIKRILNYGSAILLFLVLSAIQILPTYELINQSYRGSGLGPNESLISSFNPSNFIYFIKPFVNGNPAFNSYLMHFTEDEAMVKGLYWEVSGYLGLLAIIFFVLGLFKYILGRKNKEYVLFFLILILVSFFFAFGQFNPWFKFLWQKLPYFKSFRVTSRFLLLITFAIALVAAYGLDYWHKLIRRKISKTVISIAAAAFLLALAVDLFSFGYHYNKMDFDSRRWLEQPQSARLLQQDKSLYRVYSFGWLDSWNFLKSLAVGWQGDQKWFLMNLEVLPPDNNLLYQIAAPGGNTGMSIKRSLVLEKVLGNGIKTDYKFPKKRFVKVSDGFLNVLGMQNVKYILSFYELENKNLELKKRIGFGSQMLPAQIYENKKFMPRFFLMNRARYIPDENWILFGLINGQFDPHKEVFLSNGRADLENPLSQGVLEIKKYAPTHLVLNVRTNGDGFLVVNNTYYSGWQATDNGQKTKILLADYNFQAIKLNKGEHVVEFKYQPKAYRIGKYISLAGLVLLGLLLFLQAKRRKLGH